MARDGAVQGAGRHAWGNGHFVSVPRKVIWNQAARVASFASLATALAAGACLAGCHWWLWGLTDRAAYAITAGLIACVGAAGAVAGPPVFLAGFLPAAACFWSAVSGMTWQSHFQIVGGSFVFGGVFGLLEISNA